MTWDPFLKVLVVVMRMAPCYLIFVEKKFELLNPYESFQTFFLQETCQLNCLFCSLTVTQVSMDIKEK